MQKSSEWFCIFARIFSDVQISLKVAAGVQKAAGSCGGSPQTALAIPGTIDLGKLNIRVYLITHLCTFATLKQDVGSQTDTEGLEGYFPVFTLQSRLRWVCRKLLTAAGEARKQLWHSAQTSASRADIG